MLGLYRFENFFVGRVAISGVGKYVSEYMMK